MKRGGVIAVAGKGGTGKTAISALLIRELKESVDGDGDDICILAVDADADSNLPDALGISYNKSVGDIREELLEEKQQDVALDLRAEFEGKIAEIIEEEEYFDLLVMGRPEGPGCYCPVNHILRMVIDTLARNYDYTVIDCEAGLEHLSRRTTRDVDVMIAVLDTTLKSIKTALRLKEIAAEIDVDVQRIFTIANKIPAGAEGRVRAEAEKYGIEIEDIIPFDRLVEEYDFSGKPIIDLPDSAPSVIGVKRIAMRIINNQQAV
ncbi:MAG: AAA family ATPase [Methanophagales archaeon]|nr:AAA family ATPase [Methanophagales archaeon]